DQLDENVYVHQNFKEPQTKFRTHILNHDFEKDVAEQLNEWASKFENLRLLHASEVEKLRNGIAIYTYTIVFFLPERKTNRNGQVNTFKDLKFERQVEYYFTMQDLDGTLSCYKNGVTVR
ncbi:46477_t:CDS:2, partial [Gigaspora margarita]